MVCAPSPLAGEGWGGGYAIETMLKNNPHPRPLPARGRGALVAPFMMLPTESPYLLTVFSNVRSMALPRETAESSASLAVF